MKTGQFLFILSLFLVMTSSTCNKKSTDDSAEEIRDEINSSSEASSSADGKEIRKEINEMSESSSSKDISRKCSDDMKEYQDNVDKLIALSKKRAQGDDSESAKAEMQDINKKLQKLGKEMEKNPEMFSDPDCANAWMKMSQEYATYMMNNISDFMPQQK
jgi:hypothetical protein